VIVKTEKRTEGKRKKTISVIFNEIVKIEGKKRERV
jgi:hypothetical protein